VGTPTLSIKRFFYSLALILSHIRAFFSHDHHKLHAARFARLHELSHLLIPGLDDLKTGLLLGVSHFNHFACVRPTKTRQELGNLLAFPILEFGVCSCGFFAHPL